jgi:alkanesulfonate monooxygenase SsuD/methylene tetrahydromethanopterin reductase-like flavin-dependent oxidoreductase (luciferase family)
VPPEEAAAYPYVESQRAKIESMRRRAFVGTAGEVREKLTRLAEQHGFDELVIVTWTYDPEPRHRSYELLADAFGLAASS